MQEKAWIRSLKSGRHNGRHDIHVSRDEVDSGDDMSALLLYEVLSETLNSVERTMPLRFEALTPCTICLWRKPEPVHTVTFVHTTVHYYSIPASNKSTDPDLQCANPSDEDSFSPPVTTTPALFSRLDFLGDDVTELVGPPRVGRVSCVRRSPGTESHFLRHDS